MNDAELYSKTKNMTYPMTALGKLRIGKREYGAGEIFDAEEISAVNYLKTRGRATVVIRPAPPSTPSGTGADAVKADAPSEGEAGNANQDGSPIAGAEGNTHDNTSPPAAQGSGEEARSSARYRGNRRSGQ